MKNLLYLSFLFLVVGCNGQENKTEDIVPLTNDSIPFNEDFAFLIGKWKEVEYRGSNGAESFIKKIKNKQTLTFEKDGSVIIEKDNIKDNGKYEVHSDKYNKKLHISSPKGDSFYFVSFKEKDKKMTLTPVTSEYEIICDEGCSNIYKKIK